MEQTLIQLHTHFQVGQVGPRIFGGFAEHLGRCIYGGLYDPDSSHADEDGFRTDVIAALRRLNMTTLRYPGGNFAQAYHWCDGVGPVEQRPVLRDPNWQHIEPNRFGTDECVKLCRKMGWTPMLTVNVGAGTPEEACNWVEYCNCPTGTKYADMRSANGSSEPHDVKLWCIGNEVDGPWEIGHVPPLQYAMQADQTAKMMKMADPAIELVFCGTCKVSLDTYMEWDRQVLEYLGDAVDYMSAHRYVTNHEDDTPGFLAVTNAIDKQIEDMDAVCRFVQAKRRSDKRAYLSVDEWGVWYRTSGQFTWGRGKFAPAQYEEVYNLEDALVTAGFLNSFIRHADVVKIATLAQVVNVVAPIITRGDDILIQSIFYPFEMFSNRAAGVSLRPSVSGPKYESAKYGEVHYIDSSATLDGGRLSVFLTNRSLDESATVTVQLADRDLAALQSADLLTGDGPKSANSFEQPNLIQSRPFDDVQINAGRADITLPPLAVAAITFNLA